MKPNRLFYLALCCLIINGCKTLFVQKNQKVSKEPVTQTASKTGSFPMLAYDLTPEELLEHQIALEPDTQQETSLEAISIIEPNLWIYLSKQQTIAQYAHPKVDDFRKHFLKKPIYLVQRARKAAPYLHYIISELEKRNMPIELAFTPMVESNFDPLAHSEVQAAGLWQFMPKTAKGFGLKINSWYDGRRDIVASTEAALDYYQYLNKRFDGDWLLTVAAYNYGEGNIRKAIRKNKKANKKVDYWSLPLPKETRRHIPKWIAISDVFLNSSKYSIELPFIENQPAFATVDIQAPANLVQLAKITDIDKEHFYRLNPAFNKLFIPAQHKQASILVPINELDAFEQKVANAPVGTFNVSISYRVKSGDNLSSIAYRNKTSVSELKALNHLSSSFLKVGQQLKLPGSVELDEQEHSFFATLTKNKKRRRYQIYKVRSGDSLWKIARKFSVTTTKLARWNGLNKKRPIRVGQKLKVWPKNRTSYASNFTVSQSKYKVRSGDSLYTISKKFNVKIKQLTKWNNLNPQSYLQPGQTLKVYP